MPVLFRLVQNTDCYTHKIVRQGKNSVSQQVSCSHVRYLRSTLPCGFFPVRNIQKTGLVEPQSWSPTSLLAVTAILLLPKKMTIPMTEEVQRKETLRSEQIRYNFMTGKMQERIKGSPIHRTIAIYFLQILGSLFEK